jgi:hypothetical protein
MKSGAKREVKRVHRETERQRTMLQEMALRQSVRERLHALTLRTMDELDES